MLLAFLMPRHQQTFTFIAIWTSYRIYPGLCPFHFFGVWHEIIVCWSVSWLAGRHWILACTKIQLNQQQTTKRMRNTYSQTFWVVDTSDRHTFLGFNSEFFCQFPNSSSLSKLDWSPCMDHKLSVLVSYHHAHHQMIYFFEVSSFFTQMWFCLWFDGNRYIVVIDEIECFLIDLFEICFYVFLLFWWISRKLIDWSNIKIIIRGMWNLFN